MTSKEPFWIRNISIKQKGRYLILQTREKLYSPANELRISFETSQFVSSNWLKEGNLALCGYERKSIGHLFGSYFVQFSQKSALLKPFMNEVVLCP